MSHWLNDSFIYLASFVLFAFKFWLKGIFKLYNALIANLSTSRYIYYLEVNQYNLTIAQQIAFSNSSSNARHFSTTLRSPVDKRSSNVS